MTGATHVPNPVTTRADHRPLLKRLRYTPLMDVMRGRITGRLDLAHVITRAQLPDPLHTLVTDVTRKTRLWRAERSDVARELIAHFRDGLELGASPAELAGMFGDATRAAKLIRRAKKRNRPWPWRVARNTVRTVAILSLVLCGMYLVITARFFLGQPLPSIDYRPQLNANASAVADQNRAWPKYREALLQLGVQPEAAIDTTAWNRRPRPGEEGWQEFEQYLLNHQPALAKAREAAAMPGLGFIADYGVTPEDQKLWPESKLATEASDEDGMFSILLPYLGSLRGLARTLQLDAERSAATGDGSIVVADVAAMLGIARHVRETPLIINDLVALAVFNLAVSTLDDVLTNWPQTLSDAQLRELAHRLAAWDDSMLKVRLDGERIGFDDLLQRIYTDDGHGDGRVSLAGLRKLSAFEWLSSMGQWQFSRNPFEYIAAPAICELMLGRKAMRAEFERMIDLAVADSSKPLWLRERSRFEEEIEAMAASPVERLRKWPVVMLMPALGKAWENSERSILGRDATLSALALTLYQRQHGEWPASLEQLTPSLLPSVPIDRFDGQALKYAVHDGKPVVYVVGVDRKDDGGRRPAPGTDPGGQVVSQWRPHESPGNLPDGDWILWPTSFEPRYKFNEHPD